MINNESSVIYRDYSKFVENHFPIDLKEKLREIGEINYSSFENILLSKGGGRDNIVLVNGNKIVSDDSEIANTFNDFFKNTVASLGIAENRFLISEVNNKLGAVEQAIEKLKCHPSIISMKENIQIQQEFSFSGVNADEFTSEINNLNSRKAGTFMDIPAKQLTQAVDIITEPLTHIWNEEIVKNRKFPSKLKLADITPIFTKLQHFLVENYRPVSILPSVSKIFERLMQKQVNEFVENHLSPYLCG